MRVELHERPALDARKKPVEVTEIHIIAQSDEDAERLEVLKQRMITRTLQSGPCDPGRMILWMTREP